MGGVKGVQGRVGSDVEVLMHLERWYETQEVGKGKGERGRT